MHASSKLRSAALVGAWVIAAGCAGAGPAVPSGPATPDGFVVTNETSATICRLQATRCDLEPPDAHDILPAGAELAPGATMTLDVPDGCWNVRAEDCDGRFVTSVAGVTVTGGALVPLTP